jgi:hypothetical protein
MIRDFNQTVEQLKELAKIINEFQSEAVQLKLIELLFSSKGLEILAATPVKEKEKKAKAVAAPAEAPASEPSETPVVVKRRPGRPPKIKTDVPVAKKPRKRSTDRPGPSMILKQLVDNNFFSDKRTIGEVVDYCQNVYKYDYKSTDLSGTLAKLAKDGFLVRAKNPESNQFEYSKE